MDNTKAPPMVASSAYPSLENGSGQPNSAGFLKRDIGRWSLLFTGLSSMIGSGWLFGAERAASLAGPAAIFAWLIGAFVVLVIATVASELGAMFQVSGGLTRYAQVTHGALVGFLTSWSNWISIVSVIPIEAEASIQYMSSWPAPWARALFINGELTLPGLVLAGALVVVYFLLNFWGVKLFARSNTLITLFKLVVPSLTSIALIAASFHSGNVIGTTDGGFLPYGMSGLLTAVATSGIIFAFNGFQSPLNLAGEAKNPDRAIPFAIIGSVVIGGITYVLLQIAYLGAIGPEHLQHGWAHVSFSSPFAQLALAFNLNWIALMLYADAFVSPSGAGITDMATTSRMILGIQQNGLAPAILGRIHPVYGVPRPSLWFNLAVSFVFLYFFRGWGKLAGTISVATAISFLMIPISAMSLRRTSPELRRPVRVPLMGVMGMLAFVSATELLYWARWPLTAEVIALLIAPLPIYFWYRRGERARLLPAEFRCAIWLLLFLPTIAFISWAGSPEFGGNGLLSYGWDMLVVAIVAAGFCHWGTHAALPIPTVGDLLPSERPLVATAGQSKSTCG
jgi:amino acid transporter